MTTCTEHIFRINNDRLSRSINNCFQILPLSNVCLVRVRVQRGVFFFLITANTDDDSDMSKYVRAQSLSVINMMRKKEKGKKKAITGTVDEI